MKPRSVAYAICQFRMTCLAKASRVAGMFPLLALLLAAQPAYVPFADGDRVAFVGDSITHIGRYHVFVADYYHTRFPERAIEYFNAGIGGDTAGLVLKRIEKDILPFRPNRAVIMVGMNDVGQDHFGSAMPSPEQARSRAAAVAAYRTRLPQLVERLRAEKIEVALITPSPHDETAQIPYDNRIGKQASLSECAEFVRSYGREQGIPVIEFQAPLLEMTRQVQVKNPTRSLIGKDRVHPGDEGQLLMAALFLKSQSVPSLVARARVDAASGRAETENCDIRDVARAPAGLTFRYEPKALPFPLVNGYDTAEELLGFTERFNREILAVSGLGAGTYSLAVDGVELGRYEARELASGVNLATNRLSPMQIQASTVAKLNDDRAALVLALRDLQWVVFRLDAGGIPHDDMAAARQYLDGKEGRPDPANPRVKRYFREYQDRDRIVARIRELDEDIRQARNPRPHEVRITLHAGA